MNALPWHEDHWSRLQARREHGALPHALLLCGAAGLGKRAFAQRFVRGLLCTEPVHGEACGHCRGCRLSAAGSHPDRVELTFGLRKDGTPRTEIVVDQIRELSARLAMRSQLGGWQVVTIDPADAMNAAAANALLKTLEEPAAQTMLILLADAPWRLPPTIRSRCQRIEFHLPEPALALAWLQREGVADGRAALAKWLRSSRVAHPAASMTPVRNSIEERCPSPMPRMLITNRRQPPAVPAWSGCATILGLHNAAPSMAYSLVNAAPSSSIRISER